MSYESYPPQAPLAEYTSQNTHVYPQHLPPQYPKATSYIQIQPYPFCEYSQVLPQPRSGIMGAQQPATSPGPRIEMEPYRLQPHEVSSSYFPNFPCPGLESPGFFPSLTRLTPMQPNFLPTFTGYFLCFDRSCQFIQQRNSETHFTEMKYPPNCHTFYNPKSPYPARSGGTAMATERWIGDPCFTAAGVSSPPALPIGGDNNIGSFIGDPGPMQTHSISNGCRPYGFNPPLTGSPIQGLGIRTNDTNPPTLENNNSYPPTVSVDARASAFERNTSSSTSMRISDHPKLTNSNTHKGMDSDYSEGVINSSKPLTFRYTRDSGLENIGNFNNSIDNTMKDDEPAIFLDDHMNSCLFQERIAFNIPTGGDHSTTRVPNNAHRKNPRSSDLDANVFSRNQVSQISTNPDPISVESESYATMSPLALHTHTMATHPTGHQKAALDKNTENMEANTKDAATETLVSSFNPLDSASPTHTAGSSPRIKFKAYKCCNCNTSHYEPFTSDQDICYNCNHTVCRACYNFWECCNCNTLGRFSNHTCDECRHEKCPRKCLFQIITKEVWLRVESLRATENRGTAEQQRGEGMHKLGRMGDSGNFGVGGRSGDNGPVKGNFKPGTAGEREGALKSLVSLREKAKASSKSGVAEPLLPAAPSHHQRPGQSPPADVSGPLVTGRASDGPGEDGICYGAPKKGHENSNRPMAQVNSFSFYIIKLLLLTPPSLPCAPTTRQVLPTPPRHQPSLGA